MLSGLKLSTVWEIQNAFEFIPTGSESLDTILGGGLRTAALTEVFGGSGCGKTQLAIELMLNTIFSTLKGNVIYVSTKNCLTPGRIKSKISRYVDLIQAFGDSENEILTVENVLKKIRHKRVFELTELVFIVYHIREIVEKASLYNPIKLVVIDSFSQFLRDQPPLERIRISYELAGVLENTAIKFNCAVLITTDMSADFHSKNQAISLKPMLGDTFAHRPNQRIELQRNVTFTTAIVRKNINGRCGIVRYLIDDEKGICDA